jgi:CBS domain-containing protein
MGELVGMLTFREVIQALVKNGGSVGTMPVRTAMDDHPLTCTMETDMDEVRRMMLDRHARYMPVMDKRMLMGVISFYDVAKAVVDSQNFENKMLKAYIRDWPERTTPAERHERRAGPFPRSSHCCAHAGRGTPPGAAGRPLRGGSGNGPRGPFPCRLAPQPVRRVQWARRAVGEPQRHERQHLRHPVCVTNFGESHGPAIGCVIDGCPPGMAAVRGRHPARPGPAPSRHQPPCHAAQRARCGGDSLGRCTRAAPPARRSRC